MSKLEKNWQRCGHFSLIPNEKVAVDFMGFRFSKATLYPQ